MANATITGTASNFGSISGVLAGEAGTVAGTITGTVSGTLTGSVGVPGAGVPSGGTTGQVLKKVSNTDYDTTWGTDLASAAWGTITGTLSSQTDLQTALNLKADLASPALTGNPTAPTAATGDNDTTIATTAFVQQELAAGTAVAKNLEVYVRNQTGATLTAGTIVYINGSTGNRPTVTKAQANNDANSAQTFGFVKASIANNGFGYVIVRGELENVDTSALTEGQQLYLSPTTAGTWTTTKPSAPDHLVYVGIVVRAHPTQGIILVAIQNGYELDEIHDVKITTPSNGQVLKYDSAQGLWVNGTDVGGVAWGGITGTLSNQTDLQNALNAKLNVSSPAAVGDLTITGAFTTLTASSALFKYTHSTNIEYCELTRDSFTLFADTSDKSVEITNAGIRLYDPAAGAAATITFPDNSVQSIAFPGFTGYATESYVTTALGSYAPLASPALTGTPTAPTAAVDTNTTQVATTAYVVGQGYLKSATASSTYAPLASPALTGTPTAPTAAAATNTTQIATTAFVQQEVPSASTTAAGKVELATDAEAQTASSTTLALSASSALNAIHSQSYFRATAIGWGAATSGTGSGATTISGTVRVIAPTTAVGYAIANVQPSGHSRGTVGGTGGTSTPFDWSKRFVGRCRFTPRTLGTDSNTVWRVNWGKTTSTTTGDLAVRGVGFKQAASGVLVLQVHNGTTLTSVNTSTTPATNTWYDVRIESDGAGNVTLFINDSSAATSSAGPTAGSGTNANFVTVEAENLNTITGTNNSLFVSELTMMFSIA